MVAAENNIKSQFDAIKSRITKWLLADDWKLQDTTGPKTAWAIIAEDNQQKKVVVAQLHRRPDVVLLQVRVNIKDDLRNRVQNSDDREDILWDLRFLLLNTGFKFSGVEADLKTVGVIARLYLDDNGQLDKNGFLQTLSRIQDSIWGILWTLSRRLGQPGPPDEPEFLM